MPLLLPFLGGSAGGSTAWDRRFDGWHDTASDHHELVDDIADAELVVLPTDWYWVRGPSWASRPDRDLAHRLAGLHDRARQLGVPTVVHFTGDRSCDRVGLEGAIVLREGAFRSRMGSDDRVLPAFAEDLVAEHLGGVPEIRRRGERAVVGFCGLAGRRRGAATIARRLAFHVVVAARERRFDPSPRLGEEIRSTALELLGDDPSVDTNFVVRDSSVFFREADSADLVDVRKEYVDNMASCDYVLCVRGSGNYSYRLYEALSMGRIPIVVDTTWRSPPLISSRGRRSPWSSRRRTSSDCPGSWPPTTPPSTTRASSPSRRGRARRGSPTSHRPPTTADWRRSWPRRGAPDGLPAVPAG